MCIKKERRNYVFWLVRSVTVLMKLRNAGLGCTLIVLTSYVGSYELREIRAMLQRLHVKNNMGKCQLNCNYISGEHSTLFYVVVIHDDGVRNGGLIT